MWSFYHQMPKTEAHKRQCGGFQSWWIGPHYNRFFTPLYAGVITNLSAAGAGISDGCLRFRVLKKDKERTARKKNNLKLKPTPYMPLSLFAVYLDSERFTLSSLNSLKGQLRCLAVLFMQPIRCAGSVSAAKWYMEESWKSILALITWSSLF